MLLLPQNRVTELDSVDCITKTQSRTGKRQFQIPILAVV